MTPADLLRAVRRVVVLIVGVTIILIGLAMVVLPGPAIVVIPLGLAVLASEFVWARRLLRRVKEQVGLGARPTRPEP